MDKETRQRLINEYIQLYTRRKKLAIFLLKVEVGVKEALRYDEMQLLEKQHEAMREYQAALEKRMVLEGVDLEKLIVPVQAAKGWNRPYIGKCEQACEFCKYEDKDASEFPCCDCMHAHDNLWEAKEC